MKHDWNYFYKKIKSELLNIQNDFNTPYLSVLQDNTVLLEKWIETINVKHYTDIFQRYSIAKINKKNLSLYSFYFDWCNIYDELYISYKKEPTSFDEFVSKIYYTFDFLLSYNSLIDNPDDVNSELYYVQTSGGEVLYESKFPPQLYDIQLNRIDYTIEFDYCETILLKEKKLLRQNRH